ncbi:MAG: ABC transporter ATP-binding protein [Candidatus Faecousia sp.]|nr:ABC transporter ATP-binding protein [Bacillota bacterium]MDY4219581.1 ABC transporter ATP-binding protein [Candidatus Faecousia sp.]
MRHSHPGIHTQPVDMKSAWGKLLRFAKPWLPMGLTGLALAMVASIFALMGPDKLRDMSNTIQAGLLGALDMDAILRTGIFLVALYALSSLGHYIQNLLTTTFTQRVSQALRGSISRKINKVPLGYYNGVSFGDVLSRVTNDVDTIGQTLNQSLGGLVTAITMFLGSLIMMFVTNAAMAATAIVSTILGFGLMILMISRSQKFFVGQQRALGQLNGHVEEVYAGHNVVKAYNGEREAKDTFRKINKELYRCAWKSQFLSGLMQPLMGFVGNLGYVCVCVAGAVLVKNGKADFGTIVAFMVYVRQFTNPLSQMAQAATSLQSAAAASTRVFEFLEQPELSDESEKTQRLEPEQVRGDVEFSHVHFGYEPDRMIIHDFSAKARAGQKIAIVGPTGAGKTTLVNLLMRFYELNGGEIRVDGRNIADLTRENVHDLFCMVLQDTWLFEGTIRENIVYDKKGVTDEQVQAACKAVGLDHFIRTLPQGYDTQLNDRVNLSAGQKQLVTIARAMIENAPLLILDEATSSVDTRTEALVQAAMDKLTENRTSFVIAHRLSTIRNADLILVLKDGDVVESGTHQELLDKGGFYASLYNSQFEGTVA